VSDPALTFSERLDGDYRLVFTDWPHSMRKESGYHQPIITARKP
jgi:hypothetical protein